MSRPLTVTQLGTLDTIRELEQANGCAWLQEQGSRATSLERRGLVRRTTGHRRCWTLTTEGRSVARTVQACRALRRFLRSI